MTPHAVAESLSALPPDDALAGIRVMLQSVVAAAEHMGYRVTITRKHFHPPVGGQCEHVIDVWPNHRTPEDANPQPDVPRRVKSRNWAGNGII